MTGETSHLQTFLRFLAVGGGFSLGYALITTALINLADAPPLSTSIIVYVLCIPLAYSTQRVVAFRGRAEGSRGLAIYAATQIACLAFVAAITSRLVSYVFVWDTMLYLVTAGLAALASYLICRFIIFRTPRDKGAQ